ncbi:hypothetical protein ACP70R_037181 [Stipagrostis hirtigluma subsp. patula]
MAAAGGGEIAIPMPAAAPGGRAGDELRGRERAAAKPEKSLNRFVRIVAFGEWAGNAFGALAFLWATVVLLGGFCKDLHPDDFRFATVVIFMEAFRWISLSFTRMLARPQEGNEVVLLMGLCIDLVDQVVMTATMKYDDTVYYPSDAIGGILKVALLIVMSKLKLRGAPQLLSQPRRHRQLLLWAFLIAIVLLTAYDFRTLLGERVYLYSPVLLADLSSQTLTKVLAVVLLNLRPRRIAGLTSSSSFGRMLLSSTKIISALWQAFHLVLNMMPIRHLPYNFYKVAVLVTPFDFQLTIMVLSLGSLQTPANSLFGRCVDVIMHIFFLFNLIWPLPSLFLFFLAKSVSTLTNSMSLIMLLAALLIQNLQIPASVLQIVLSCWSLHGLLADHEYHPLPKDSSPNLVPAIAVFDVLALCQGALYIMASVLGLLSFFPQRLLLRRSKFSGQHGAKAVELYYQRAYATRMEIGVFARAKNISFANFAIESLSSGSRELQIAGVCVLDNILQRRDYNEELITRVVNSSTALSTLISMLGWTEREDSYIIRLFSARVIVDLAGRLRIDRIPGMINIVSSLLDAENQPASQESLMQEGSNGESSWVCRYWQRMKEKWSIPKEPPLTSKDSLPVLGMVILKRLARDVDNCAEIGRAPDLISKITRFISYATDTSDPKDAQQKVRCQKSLKLLRRLAITEGETGVVLRQELWKNIFLLNNLECILEDSRCSNKVLKAATYIIAKLAYDEDARLEIGSTQVIIGKLTQAFITGGDEDQSLRMAAGEALANLAMGSTLNCSAILKDPWYELTRLMDMLCKDEDRVYRYLAASLLQNLLAHSRDKLLADSGASEHLRSALPTVLNTIVTAEGRELEALIGLASQICDIRECFVVELESKINGAGTVKKLVDTLNSNRKVNPEYPRMRRVIVEMIKSFVRSYPCYSTMFRQQGMMEALSKVERTPSKIEKYMVFYGNIGVVPESGPSLPSLVAEARRLIDATTSITDAQPGNHP